MGLFWIFVYIFGAKILFGTGHLILGIMSPILAACEDCDNEDVIKYLIDMGADLKVCYKNEPTPLISASLNNKIELVKLFLKRECAKNLKDDENL